MARRRRAQHPRLRARLPRRPRHRPRAELPLDRDDPAGGERGRLAQPAPPPQAPLDRAGRRRPDPRDVLPRRARGGARRGVRDRPGARTRAEPAPRSRSSTARTPRAASIEDQLVRRSASPTSWSAGRASTSAPRSATCWPTCAWSPTPPTASAWRGCSAPPSAGSGRAPSRSWRRSRRRVDIPVADALAPRRRGPRPPAGASARRWPRSRRLLDDVRAGVAAGTPLDRVLERVLERSGLRDALVREGTFEAQGRVENLEEMVRVGAEYEASDEEPTLAGFLEGIALQADADLVDQSAGRRHADDDPQRQGARVRHRADHGPRGGPLPARALGHARGAGGGAAPLLRRPHARAAHPGADPRREPGDARRPRLPAALALPRGDPARLPRRARRRAPRASRRSPRSRRARRSARRWRPATTCSTPPSARAS